MKFDFLALLESIVQGFVSFVYSVARSLYTVLRWPVRGPLRLHGRYRIQHHRQIGGVTFLYLAFFLTFYLVFKSLDFTSIAVFAAIWEAIVALPTIRQEDLWPILAGSLIGTTIVDAAIRLWLARRVRRRPRREMLIAAAEYSLFWAIPPAGLVGWYLQFGSCEEFEFMRDLPLLAFVALPLAAIASIPAALLLSGGGASRGAARRRVVLAVALTLLVVAAAHAGIRLAGAIQSNDVCGGP